MKRTEAEGRAFLQGVEDGPQGRERAGTTIAAQATPAGAGGIAVVRISGPDARTVLEALFKPSSASFAGFVPWKLHRGTVLDREGASLDDALGVFMPGPKTFTGEDCAEIHCHGGQAIVRALLESCFARGVQPAARGEFSRRAYLNGRMDLSQAEAVAEMIAAPTREAAALSLRRLEGALGRRVEAVRESLEGLRVQMSLAVDFPDDEVECLPPEQFKQVCQEACQALSKLAQGASRARLVEQGAKVVLAGEVNAGKSSLMNALLGRSRALVTDVPGTTRDFLEETLDFAGLPVRLVDTAGLRNSADPVERLGIQRSREQLEDADLVLLVVDGAVHADPEAYLQGAFARGVLQAVGGKPLILVWNKVDVARPEAFPPASFAQGTDSAGASKRVALLVSATQGEHLDDLATEARRLLEAGLPAIDDGVAPNVRQAEAMAQAASELSSLIEDIDAGLPYDVLSVRLDFACACLRDIVGLGTSQDVLNRVFASFCIGK